MGNPDDDVLLVTFRSGDCCELDVRAERCLNKVPAVRFLSLQTSSQQQLSDGINQNNDRNDSFIFEPSKGTFLQVPAAVVLPLPSCPINSQILATVREAFPLEIVLGSTCAVPSSSTASASTLWANQAVYPDPHIFATRRSPTGDMTLTLPGRVAFALPG
jgi:hypothetical protein